MNINKESIYYDAQEYIENVENVINNNNNDTNYKEITSLKEEVNTLKAIIDK